MTRITASGDFSRDPAKLKQASSGSLESQEQVTAVTASPVIGRDNPRQQRGFAMPILMMALLALLVFGVIGILLTAAMVMEHSKRKHLAEGDAARPAASGPASSLHPRL